MDLGVWQTTPILIVEKILFHTYKLILQEEHELVKKVYSKIFHYEANDFRIGDFKNSVLKGKIFNSERISFDEFSFLVKIKNNFLNINDLKYLNFKLNFTYRNVEFFLDQEYFRSIIAKYVLKSDQEKCIIAGGFFSKYALDKIQLDESFNKIIIDNDMNIFIYCPMPCFRKIMRYTNFLKSRTDCFLISNKKYCKVTEEPILIDINIPNVNVANVIRVITNENKILCFIFYYFVDLFKKDSKNVTKFPPVSSENILLRRHIELHTKYYYGYKGIKYLEKLDKSYVPTYIMQTNLVNSFDLDLCKIFYSFKSKSIYLHVSFFELFQKLCIRNNFILFNKDLNYAKSVLNKEIQSHLILRENNLTAYKGYLQSYTFQKQIFFYNRFLKYYLKFFFNIEDTDDLIKIIAFFNDINKFYVKNNVFLH
jgi:hypothetical protein